MDRNWASPWDEEATTSANTANPTFKGAPVPTLSLDNHESPWSTVEGEGWASDAQSRWAFDDGKPQRERRLSETSGWGISDGSRRAHEAHQNLFSPKSRPLSLQLPLRPPSPDPWSTVSANDERVRVQKETLDRCAEPKESAIVNHEYDVVADIDQSLDSTNENGAGVLKETQLVRSANEVEVVTEPSSIPDPPQDFEASKEDLQSFDQIHPDTTSSRPSSTPSHHGDDSTHGSSRTSFEQEPGADLSKELISRFDGSSTEIEETRLVRRTESLSENKSNDTRESIAPEDESDFDDFGDFEEETQPSIFKTSDILPAEDSGLDNKDHGSYHELAFNFDPNLLGTLLLDICPGADTFENPNSTSSQYTNDDVFTTIEERKTWHRISRFGTMRKHDQGNDDNYRRVKWQNSKIRDETLKVVSRWRTEDGISGGVVLGGGDRGSMFGWDNKDKRNSGPINMSAIWAERAAKHRSMPLPSSLKASLKSPPVILPTNDAPSPKLTEEDAPSFGWSTGDKSHKSTSSTPSSPFSLEPPPLSAKPKARLEDTPSFGWSTEDKAVKNTSLQSSSIRPSSPFSLEPPASAQRPTSMDLSRHPRIAAVRGLGHRSTMSLDRKLPPSTSIPVIQPVKPRSPESVPEKLNLSESSSLTCDDGDDDDDWGDMVSSTPDSDAVFPVADEAVQDHRKILETQGSRNRADSAPHPPVLERVSQTKRPISLQVGALPTSSLLDLADLNHSSHTAPSEKEPEQTAPFKLMPKPEIHLPSVNTSTEMPKLSITTDDFDPWNSNPMTATVIEKPATEAPPMPAPKLHETTIDDFNTWASFDDLPNQPQKINTHPASPISSNWSKPPSNPILPSSSMTALDEMDGWGDADFSIFETVDPKPATVGTFAKEEPLKQVTARHSEERQQTEVESRSVPNTKDAQKSAEEERIVRIIVEALPDLSYMFHR